MSVPRHVRLEGPVAKPARHGEAQLPFGRMVIQILRIFLQFSLLKPFWSVPNSSAVEAVWLGKTGGAA